MPLGAPAIHDAFGIAQDGIAVRQAHGFEEFEAGDAGRARAVHHHLDVCHLAARQMQRIDHAGGRDDRRAVLVVMEDGNVHQLAQPLFDHEAIGRLDVFQIDAAEAGSQIAHAIDEGVDIRGVDFDIDRVDIGEALEENGLAFHHGLGGERRPDRPGPGSRCRSRSRRRNCLWPCSRRRHRAARRSRARARPRPANRRGSDPAASPWAWWA